MKRKKSLKRWIKDLVANSPDANSLITQDNSGNSIIIKWKKLTHFDPDFHQIAILEEEELWAFVRNSDKPDWVALEKVAEEDLKEKKWWLYLTYGYKPVTFI